MSESNVFDFECTDITDFLFKLTISKAFKEDTCKSLCIIDFMEKI